MFEGITKKRKNRAFNYAGWGLLVLVCGIFIFTGYSPNLNFAGNGASVATVNGELITYAEFSRFYERAQEERDKNGKLSTAEQSKLQREVIDTMVNRALIIQAAKKQGIIVSPKEMADYLMEIPQFQDNGKFSLLRYKQMLKGQGMTEARFEQKVAEDMLVQKMNMLYMRTAKDDKFLKDQEDEISKIQLNVQFIRKPKTEVVSDTEISQAEIEKYIKEKNDKIATYYKAHVDQEFSKGEEVKAQHILVKTSPEVNDAQALEKIKKIRSEVTATNFSDLAKKYSDDPGSKAAGGELGFFGRGRMAKEFEDAAFSAPVGQVTEPVKTPFGYHIIKVTQKQDKNVETLPSVQGVIARKLLKEEKMSTALKDIKAVLAQGPDAAQKMVAQKGWTWDETGVFGMGDMMIPKLGEDQKVVDAALSLSEANPIYKDVVETPDAIYLVKYKAPVAGKEAAKNGLSQADMFKQIFERQKSYEAFQGWMDNLRKNASVKINPQMLNQ